MAEKVLMPEDMPMSAKEYQELIAAVSSGECMVPECFTLNPVTTSIFSSAGIGNIATHLSHYADAYRAIGLHDHVLDVGCGCGLGVRLYRLRTQGRVVAVDKSPSIDIATNLYPAPGVEYYRCDLATDALPEGCFHTVTMTDVYEHLTEDVAASVMTQLRGIMWENGKLVVSTPLDSEGADPHDNPFHRRRFNAMGDVLTEISAQLLPTQSVQFVRSGGSVDQMRGSYV